MIEFQAIKPLPFSRDIPRYESEPPLNGVPGTAAESIFNDPDLSESAGVVSDYISPTSNSNKRRAALERIRKMMEDPGSRSTFNHYLSQLQGRSARGHDYEELLHQLKGTVDYRGNNFPDFPEVSRETIPQRSIVLVNDCLRAVYPKEFGSVIPRLTTDVIRVMSGRKMEEYRQLLNRTAIHSVLRQPEGAEPAGDSPSYFSATKPDFMVMEDLPGRPIFFSDTMLKQIAHLPTYMKEVIVAFWLLHENTHRAAREKNIAMTSTNYNQLYDLATSTLEDLELRLGSPEEKEELSNWLNGLKRYVLYCEPLVKIEGALIRLFAKDQDGAMREMIRSGYDLNEEIVEILLQRPHENLYSYVRKTFTSWEAEALLPVFRDPENSKSSHVRRISSEEAKSYLETLGLTDGRDLLQAYAHGRIPLLHAEKHPGELYSV